MTNRKFKAIICDIDGTLIINKKEALPSKKVIAAIKKANKLIHFTIATSRPLFIAQPIIDALAISEPCVLGGGAQIYDSFLKQVVWEKQLNPTSVKQVTNILKGSAAQVFFFNGFKNLTLDALGGHGVLHFWVHGIEIGELHQLEVALAKINNLSIHRIASWKKGLTDLLITHKNGSKEHGIRKLLKILGLKKGEVIAVGDGMNDLPLFKACGFKVAMGNAGPELKAVADYVAPSVEDDGIVDVIKKFIL